MFTIVVPFYNGHKYIERLLDSIPEDIPVIIVDDLSETPLQPLARKNVRQFRLNRKGYFAGAVSAGWSQCNTDVLVLNQDIYFKDDRWLRLIEETKEDFFGERIKGDRDDWGDVGYVHGTFMYVRRQVIEQVGDLDHELYPLWGCTADYQRRVARAGYSVKSIKKIPGFIHTRKNGIGDSIRSTLENEGTNRFLMVPPEISIIIPVHGYKYAQYLPDAINSLIGGNTVLGYHPGQTFTSFEVIIIDDGSPEQETRDLIADLVGDGNKGIRAFRSNRNPIGEDGRYKGKPTALNAGIKMAKGNYITVLDADDMMEPERLRVLWDAAEANPHSIIYDDICLFMNGMRGEELPMREYDFDELLFKNSMHIGIFYHRSAWVEAGGYSNNMKYGREDWCFNVAAGEKGWCGIHIKKPLYLYRREGQNRTLTNTDRKWHQRFLMSLQEIYPHLYKGERPMGCCGKSNQTNLKAGKKMLKFSLKGSAPGEDGMTALVYQGTRVAGWTEYGYSTGNRYRVSPKQPFYVDNRDLYSDNRRQVGLLEKTEGPQRIMFKIYNEPAPIVEEPVKTEAKLTVTEVVSVQETEVKEVEENELDLDRILKTITYLRRWLRKKEYTESDLRQILAHELGNKNRVGAVKMIEEEINGQVK